MKPVTWNTHPLVIDIITNYNISNDKQLKT